MKLIEYIKIFAFLAFAGSAFLSTVFHNPVFTIFWFFVMMLFMFNLYKESSALIILGFVALAYIPLGLILVLSKYADKTASLKDAVLFAWALAIFALIELVLAVIWFYKEED